MLPACRARARRACPAFQGAILRLRRQRRQVLGRLRRRHLLRHHLPRAGLQGKCLHSEQLRGACVRTARQLHSHAPALGASKDTLLLHGSLHMCTTLPPCYCRATSWMQPPPAPLWTAGPAAASGCPRSRLPFLATANLETVRARGRHAGRSDKEPALVPSPLLSPHPALTCTAPAPSTQTCLFAGRRSKLALSMTMTYVL